VETRVAKDPVNPGARGSLKARLARWPAGVVRYRWPIVGLWTIASAILVPAAGHLENRLEVAARMPRGQAQAVENDLQNRFRSPFTNRVILVAEGLPAFGEPGGKEILESIVAAVERVPGVAGILSSLDKDDDTFRGKSGGFLLIIGLDAGGKPVETLLPSLRATTAALTAKFQPAHPKAWLGWTGVAPLNADLRRSSSEDARSAELRVLPFTLLLLLLAFGSVVAATLPLLVGILSIALSLGVAAWVAQHVTLSIFIQSLSSMIGLGLGIDYALLTVSRFREALAEGRDAHGAAEEAARHAGWTILLSAFPVSISFAALLTIPLSEQRSVGFAGLTVTIFALLLSVTLLPAVLSFLGPRIDLLRVRPRRPAREAGGSAAWRRWGRRVISRPVLCLVLASAPLVWLAAQSRRLDTVLPAGDWLPKGSESVRAYHRLGEMGRKNLVHSVRVVLDYPPGVTIESPEGWTAAMRLNDRLGADRRVERVQCLPTVVDVPGSLRSLRQLRADVRQTLAAADGSATMFEVLPAESLAPRDQVQLARDIRKWNAAEATGLAGASLSIGGQPGFDADYEDTVAKHFHRVIGLVVGCTFLALFAGFRSLLVAVKAVLLNLLSVGAAFGALVLVFQEGHGISLFGLSGPTGSVFPIIPVLVFCIVFGLSMDYEVILVARVAEARRGGFDESGAIAEGVARTATVITSAAAIMIVVFAGFALGGFLPIQMLGFALSVAVAVDAIVVRMVIGPALLRLAGKWNWWPGHVSETRTAPGGR
jgi:RND superfamily putative drug exporter